MTSTATASKAVSKLSWVNLAASRYVSTAIAQSPSSSAIELQYLDTNGKITYEGIDDVDVAGEPSGCSCYVGPR